MIYMWKNRILILLLILVFSGCGYKQTNTQIHDTAFLKFNKSLFKEYTVVVNGKYKFKLDGCAKNTKEIECHNGVANTLYKIKSGNSLIEVYDSDNNLIMKKEIYVGSSNTVEVDL